MKKNHLKTVLVLGIILIFWNQVGGQPMSSTDCDSDNLSGGQIDECIAKLKRDAEALAPAHENNKKELSSLQKQVANLATRINSLGVQLKNLEKKIDLQSKELGNTQEVFENKAANYYMLMRLYDPLSTFFAKENATEAFRQIAMRESVMELDRKVIEKYGQEISNLRQDKEKMEKNKVELAALRSSVGKRAEFLSGEVAKVESYLDELDSRQQELLALKAGGFATSIGDTPPTLEPCTGPSGSPNFCDPGFRPAFAAFSFGAPHRTGMSQYGALGRSQSGQSAETILAAYYQGATLQKGYPVPDTINVTGVGRISFEDRYLMGIYEVPESWGDKGGFEALKAQAVAARTYALYYTGGGARSICATESCQVFKNSPKTGKWAEAVRATRGWVLTKGGSPIGTYYSASTGGYTISQWGWTGIKDTDGEWPQGAYERKSGSPWFYKAWFKSRAGASCGRSGPWLTSEQMADILNAHHVLYKGGGEASRVSPLIEGGCWKGNPYSVSELRSIGGFDSVSSVSVVYGNSGSTQSVTFGTNKGSVTIASEELRRAFNLRAPGNVGIKSSLFNIEKL